MEFCAIQFVPLLVVLSKVPISPPDHPVDSFRKKFVYRLFEVPLCWASQLSPPLVVLRIEPFVVTIQPVEEEVK